MTIYKVYVQLFHFTGMFSFEQVFQFTLAARSGLACISGANLHNCSFKLDKRIHLMETRSCDLAWGLLFWNMIKVKLCDITDLRRSRVNERICRCMAIIPQSWFYSQQAIHSYYQITSALFSRCFFLFFSAHIIEQLSQLNPSESEKSLIMMILHLHFSSTGDSPVNDVN